jgi:hypothetical protein
MRSGGDLADFAVRHRAQICFQDYSVADAVTVDQNKN